MEEPPVDIQKFLIMHRNPGGLGQRPGKMLIPYGPRFPFYVEPRHFRKVEGKLVVQFFEQQLDLVCTANVARGEERMKIVVLDGNRLNPGDNPWDEVAAYRKL